MEPIKQKKYTISTHILDGKYAISLCASDGPPRTIFLDPSDAHIMAAEIHEAFPNHLSEKGDEIVDSDKIQKNEQLIQELLVSIVEHIIPLYPLISIKNRPTLLEHGTEVNNWFSYVYNPKLESLTLYLAALPKEDVLGKQDEMANIESLFIRHIVRALQPILSRTAVANLVMWSIVSMGNKMIKLEADFNLLAPDSELGVYTDMKQTELK